MTAIEENRKLHEEVRRLVWANLSLLKQLEASALRNVRLAEQLAAKSNQQAGPKPERPQFTPGKN